jgi:hypothetical protein
MNTQLEKPVESFLGKHLNKQLLKHAAGSNMFCPGCDKCLDCKSTVLATIHRTVNDGPEEIVRSYTLCAKCWDERGPVVRQAVDKVVARSPQLKARLEVVDGREVFKR